MHCKDSGTSWPSSFLLYSMLIYIGDSGILQPSTPMDNGLVPAPAVTWHLFMTVWCFGFLYPSATISIVSYTWSVGPVSALAVTSIPFCLFHYSGDWSGSFPRSDTPGCAGNHVSHIHTVGSVHPFLHLRRFWHCSKLDKNQCFHQQSHPHQLVWRHTGILHPRAPILDFRLLWLHQLGLWENNRHSSVCLFQGVIEPQLFHELRLTPQLGTWVILQDWLLRVRGRFSWWWLLDATSSITHHQICLCSYIWHWGQSCFDSSDIFFVRNDATSSFTYSPNIFKR